MDVVADIDRTPPRHDFAHDLTMLIPRLRSHARALTRDRDAAEDLLQDTLLRAWKARDQFAPGTSLPAWTGTILRNAFLTRHRRIRFDAEYDEQLAEVRLARPETQSAVVELNDVRRAMAELAPEQSEALRLVSIEDISYDEAARRLGITRANFGSRVSRARRTLQRIVDGEIPRDAASPPRRAAPPPPPPLPQRSPRHGRWSAAKAAGQPLWIG